MLLSAKMEAAEVGKAILTALQIDTNATPSSELENIATTVTKKESTSADEVIKAHTGTHGSVCFVVRRPGWILCREQGKSLTDLKLAADSPLDGFELFGTVKEVGVDDEGLTEFYKKYFPFPLYKDDNMVFYNDFYGKRKMKFTTYNPYRLYQGYKTMMSRIREKGGLKGNMTGEGLVQGGIIIFGKDGKPKYAYEEETGKDIPKDDIIAAINAVKAQNSESKASKL